MHRKMERFFRWLWRNLKPHCSYIPNDGWVNTCPDEEWEGDIMGVKIRLYAHDSGFESIAIGKYRITNFFDVDYAIRLGGDDPPWRFVIRQPR